MAENNHCADHQHHRDKVDRLIEACAANTTTIKILMWLIGGAGTVLTVVASVYLPMSYQNSMRTDAQISAAISGAASNRKDNMRQDDVLRDHEQRLRAGKL